MDRAKLLRRRGITLFETLVVLALLILLFGLFLPLVQKVREAARRTQCVNNMHQLGLAVHDCVATYEKLPPSVGSFPNETSEGTLHFYLLPFIEQDNIFAKARDGDGKYSVWTNNTNTVIIKTFVCPNDASGDKVPVYDGWLATTNYAANFMCFRLGGRGLQDITDGTSNTMFFTERYRLCNQTPTAWGYNGETDWAPMFAYSSYARFQVQPSQEQCNSALPQSIHNGGIQVGMADGSARMVHDGITPQTWYYAIDPADGMVLGADW
jgi:prepilin-type processing-associated H-X9-DG protein